MVSRRKLAAAAAVYVFTQRVINGVKAANEDAADTLKAYFKESGKTSYKGIGCSTVEVPYMPAGLVRTVLGPAKTAEITRHYDRVTLTLPADAAAIVPDELERLAS